MTRNLTITCLFFQTVIVSLLFATVFVTKPAFFQHLIAAKQWGVELVMLVAITFLVLYIPFVKKIKITTVDIGILILSLWWIVSEIVFHNTFQPLQKVVFYVLIWSAVYLFIRSSSGGRNFILGIALITGTIWFFPKRQACYAALKTWNKADQFYNMRSFNTAVEAYQEAFPVLKDNGLFLQMYGKALSMDGKYKKSNQILAMAQKHLSSYIILNTLGDNCKALKNYNKAEAAYIQSGYMVPSMLLPKYLLAKLYENSGQHRKAIQIAGVILKSPVKVESTATHKMINEMKNIITQGGTTCPDDSGEKIQSLAEK
jgi:O-antigen polymerase